MKKNYYLIFGIFILALLVRFYAFQSSIYFGFDQARDAFISREIYVNKELKLIGPPASGNIGIFHGSMYWYFVGPIYLFANIETVSAIFRVINALGVFLVFTIVSKLFNKKSGYIASFLYAISYEQSQYAMFVSNPVFAAICILFMFLGFTWIIKNDKKINFAPVLIFGGAAFAIQLNLLYVYLSVVLVLGLITCLPQVKKIKFKYWVLGLLTGLFFLSTYIISEIKYDFRTLKLGWELYQRGYGIMSESESKYLLYFQKYVTEFRDNIFGQTLNIYIVYLLISIFVGWLIYEAVRKQEYRLLLLWVFGWVFLMFIGGHTAYYTNAGISVGVIVGIAIALSKVRNKYLLATLLILITFVNIKQIYAQSPKSLIGQFQPQTMLRLMDEKKVIDYMYSEANGDGFTVRITGIPYIIPTTWAYLYNTYGEPKWGYYPYFEYGSVLGFPGELPSPKLGTSCLRFRMVEPRSGIGDNVYNHDINVEDDLSTPVKKIYIGEFLIETRKARDPKCHTNKPEWKNTFN